MKEFKVGDNVKLSEVGKSRYKDIPTNPYYQTGKIIKLEEDDYYAIEVEWKNEEVNNFIPHELDKVEE
jgi:hypothetical protein